MSENDIYSELAKKLGAPVSRRFLAILEEMLTPEEASICLELMVPATYQELAGVLGGDEKDLSKKLENLVDRGILTRGETQYAFHSTLLGFHHDVADTGVHTGPHALSQKVKDLWADFFYNEWSDNWTEMASERKRSGGHGICVHAIHRHLERAAEAHPQRNWLGFRRFCSRFRRDGVGRGAEGRP